MTSTSQRFKRPRSNEDTKRSPAKRQFRNENEKRRRDLFSQLVVNLEDILNIDKKTTTSSQPNKLDKASILRETALFLKQHQQNLTSETSISSSNSQTTVDRTNDIIDFCWKPPTNIVTIEEWLQITIESMHCFFLVAKSDPYNGQIIYVSRNISSLLDYSQNELLNRSLFELILPRNHDQLRDYLLKNHRVLEKCDLSWRRGTVDEYEQCTIIGAFRTVKKENDGQYLMSLVKVNTLDRTLILNNENSFVEFTTRLNLHGKFIYIDPKAREYLGYSSYELIGHTHFDFVHPDDLPIIVRAHQIWKQNGSGKSDPYRFLSKGQQWIFLQTSCQVKINSWTGKPESYVCTTNPLQYSSDSLQKQLSCISASSHAASSSSVSVQSPSRTSTILTPSPQRRNSSTDTQITSFLSHLGDEIYRTNIRAKLNERRTRKQGEIRVREEEVKVIEDIIQFINEFEAKRSTRISSRTTNTSSSPLSTTILDLRYPQSKTHTIIQEEVFGRESGFETNYEPILLTSPLPGAIEDLSPRPSPLVSHHIPSMDIQTISSKDETINDPLTCSLFSPQQGPFSLSSPLTPFSIPSRPSPLSVSPTPSSPFPSTIHPTTNELHNINPPSSSSSSSPSSTNTKILPTDDPKRKSSFNRSLPHSLVS